MYFKLAEPNELLHGNLWKCGRYGGLPPYGQVDQFQTREHGLQHWAGIPNTPTWYCLRYAGMGMPPNVPG